MSRGLELTIGICASVFTGALVFVCFAAMNTLDSLTTAGNQATITIQQMGQSVNGATDALAATTGKLNATLDALNAPCVGFHGSVTCGPLAQLSQTEKNVGILAAKSAQQVQQSATLVNETAEAIKGAAADVHTMAQAGTGTLNAATGTIDAFQPVIGQTSAAVAHFDALIQSPDVTDTLHNANLITASWAGTSEDFHVWSHKLWNPSPCTTNKCRWARGFKVAGGYLGLAAQAGEASTFWRAIPVKVK